MTEREKMLAGEVYSAKDYQIKMTEREKMLAGEVYSAIDPQLLEELKVANDH